MITEYLAHAGENHETAAEATQHISTVGQNHIVLWVLLVCLPLVLAFFLHTVFKWKLFNTLLAVSVFLIGFSIYTYQDPGAYTFISLIAGFGIVFTTSLLRLASE